MAESVGLPDRFAVIFDRHAEAVHRFVGYRIRWSEIDDAVAEVFRIAFENRHKFDRSATSAKPWLLGIATNVTRRSHRTAERGRRAVQRSATRTIAQIDPLLAVDERLDATESVNQLSQAINRLGEVEREVLLMTVWDELAPAKIAEALQVPSATVRTHLFRARNTLRRALSEIDQDEGDDATWVEE